MNAASCQWARQAKRSTSPTRPDELRLASRGNRARQVRGELMPTRFEESNESYQPTTPVAESPSREPSISVGEAAVLTRLLCVGKPLSATPAAQTLATTTEQSPAWEPSPQASKPQPVRTRVTSSTASASVASVDHYRSRLRSTLQDSTDALNNVRW